MPEVIEKSLPLATTRKRQSNANRFIVREGEIGEGDSPFWTVLDTLTPCTRCDSGFRCVGTFDRQIDALIFAVESNDGEDGVL